MSPLTPHTHQTTLGPRTLLLFHHWEGGGVRRENMQKEEEREREREREERQGEEEDERGEGGCRQRGRVMAFT